MTLKKHQTTLHPIAVKDEAWAQLGMDLVGPLPTTARGNTYIMTVTDYYTKWAEAAPLQDKSALSVANMLYTVSILTIIKIIIPFEFNSSVDWAVQK